MWPPLEPSILGASRALYYLGFTLGRGPLPVDSPLPFLATYVLPRGSHPSLQIQDMFIPLAITLTYVDLILLELKSTHNYLLLTLSKMINRLFTIGCVNTEPCFLFFLSITEFSSLSQYILQPPTQLLRLRALGSFLILLLHLNSTSSPWISPVNAAFKTHPTLTSSQDRSPCGQSIRTHHPKGCLLSSSLPPLCFLLFILHRADGRFPRSINQVTSLPCLTLIRLQIESKMAALIQSCCPLFSVSLYPPAFLSFQPH